MLVVLHGWSDGPESFEALAGHLLEAGIAPAVEQLRLADYLTLNDQVGFDDLCAALSAAWTRHRLPRAPRSVDVVVHSTGGLVIRDWMTRGFTPASNPVRRLLMLAPASFGSPLAHKGRSFIGRVFKGYAGDRPFETGARLLRGLELASPYAWRLAERDRFDARLAANPWYGPGRVLCTVLMGTAGYGGISAAANQAGSDGTVRVASASLQALRVDLDFSTDPQRPAFELREPFGRTAFCRLPRENHSTIAFKDGGPRNALTTELVARALTVGDADFERHCRELARLSAAHRETEAAKPYTQGYQNTVVHLQDDFGADIPDYFFEAFVKRARSGGGSAEVDAALTASVQQAIHTVHACEENPAYRSLLFNCNMLDRLLAARGRDLHLSVTALPELKENGAVGYSTFGYDDIGSIRLGPRDIGRLFVPDRTLLVRLRIRRVQAERVFDFRPPRAADDA